MRTVLNSPKLQIQKSHEPFSPPAEDLRCVRDAALAIANALTDKPDWFDYYALNHAARLAFDLGLVRTWLTKEDVVAEFGSSPLLLTLAMHRMGYNVTGVDVEPGRFAGASDALGLKIVKCDIERETLARTDGSFSAIIFNEIFEHLRVDLVTTFKEILRLLKPGGRLLLSTPNGKSFGNLRNMLLFDRGLDFPVYGSYQAITTVGHMGHVREYTLTDVLEFLQSAGFECTHAVHRGRYSTNLGQLVARLFPSLRPQFSIIAQRPLRAG